MPDVRFPVEVVRGIPVVAAPEEIDITNATELRAALLEASVVGPGTLVVDMTRTLFCDSAGLHAIVGAHRRAVAEGGAVLLAVTGEPVLRILALTGLAGAIPNFTSLEEALAQTAGAASIAEHPSGPACGPRSTQAIPGDRPARAKSAAVSGRRSRTSSRRRS
jgi:anti-sigma B factor antagonist